MNGIPIRIVIDTNVLFMAIYDKNSKARRVLDFSVHEKVILFAPESVRNELIRVLKRELAFTEEEITTAFKTLPIHWIEREIYDSAIEKTSVRHKPDKAVEALALILNCGILTADRHFEHIRSKININELLAELEKS